VSALVVLAALALDTLRFADATHRARYDALRAHAAAAAGGWRHRPLTLVGNFVEEHWCGPAVSAPACDGGGVVNQERRGDAWFRLGVLHYPKDWPSVFGLVYAAGVWPKDRPWGLAFSLAVDGRTVVGEHLGALFLRFDGERVADRVPLGDGYAYRVEETTFRVRGEAPLAELARLRASPSALQARATERLDALLAEVRRGLAAHEATKCVYGPYRNDGIPPECTPTPLTAEEEAAWAERAAREIGRQRALVAENAAEMHALLTALVPAL
jgi:hypothetical protein